MVKQKELTEEEFLAEINRLGTEGYRIMIETLTDAPHSDVILMEKAE